MTEEEYKEGIEFVKKHFFVIYPKKYFTLDNIFERAKFLVRQKGIRSLIIDPYNTVQHKMFSGEREDLYISRFMSELKRFAIDNDISVNLVAHQVTPQKTEDGRYYKPDVNKIKGGDHQALFLLNYTDVHQVKDVAQAGDVMPQKSTDFYPKLLSGMVFNKIQ